MNGITASARAIHDRFNHLVRVFQSENRDSIRRSGTVEEYDLREQLLTDIVDIQRSFAEAKKQKQNKRLADEQVAKQIRDDAMKSLKDKRLKRDKPDGSNQADDDGDVPVRSAKPATPTLPMTGKQLVAQVLNEKADRQRVDQQMEQRRIELEVDRLALEREKLRVDEEKAKQQARLDEEKLRLEEQRLRQEGKVAEEKIQLEAKKWEMMSEQQRLLGEQQRVQNDLLLKLVTRMSNQPQ
jgi:hypothetical protein